MSERENKGGFQADIPADAVRDALRSVERIAGGAEPAAAAPEEGPAVVVDPAARPDPAAAGLEDEVRKLAAQLELSTTLGRETQEKLKAEHDRCLRLAA